MSESDKRIDDLTTDDREVLQRELELGRRVVEFYVGRTQIVGEHELDRVLELWREDQRDSKPLPNEVALGIGSLFGEFLRSRYRCEWTVITDGTGCDLALYDALSGWELFPRHSVAKRLKPNGSGRHVLKSLILELEKGGALVRRNEIPPM